MQACISAVPVLLQAQQATLQEYPPKRLILLKALPGTLNDKLKEYSPSLHKKGVMRQHSCAKGSQKLLQNAFEKALRRCLASGKSKWGLSNGGLRPLCNLLQLCTFVALLVRFLRGTFVAK